VPCSNQSEPGEARTTSGSTRNNEVRTGLISPAGVQGTRPYGRMAETCRCSRLVSLARPDAPSMGIMVRPPREAIPGAATGYESSWPRCHDATAWTRTTRPDDTETTRDGGFRSMTGSRPRDGPTRPAGPEAGIVLAAVKDASRRLRRWPRMPEAILDRGCARCLEAVRPGRENGVPAEPENATWDDRRREVRKMN
jgi:hypothetical protein